MYTTMLLLALQLLDGTTLSPMWNRDYEQALKRAETAKKPVAVFIASGKDGWKTVSPEGALSPEVRRLLADHYICVYIDASQPAEQALVRSFEADRLPLVVLSRDRVYQGYRHAGTLANAGLAQVLRSRTLKDAAPEYPAETGSPQQKSLYCRT